MERQIDMVRARSDGRHYLTCIPCLQGNPRCAPDQRQLVFGPSRHSRDNDGGQHRAFTKVFPWKRWQPPVDIKPIICPTRILARSAGGTTGTDERHPRSDDEGSAVMHSENAASLAAAE